MFRRLQNGLFKGKSFEQIDDEAQKTNKKYSEKGGAWDITNQWDEKFINNYHQYAANRAMQAYKNGEKYTCEDFALGVLIDFASQNGLPFAITNGQYASLDASDPSYSSVKDFKDAVFATTGANDLARSENTTQLKSVGDVKTGDLLMLKSEALETTSTKLYGHTQVVSYITKHFLFIYQGNQGNGSADPNSWRSYAGMPIQLGIYALTSGDYVRQGNGNVIKNGLLNTGNVVPFRWNFMNWNKN
jgi:hypothetical protein